MRLPVVAGQTLTSGVRTIVGSIPLNELADRIYTPWRDSRTKHGYQRKPTMGRIARLMMEIRKNKVDIPTAILLNAGHPTWQQSFSEETEGSWLDIDKYRGKFAIVDGQHRVLALKELYQENPDYYGGFKLQFVMILGATENQELEQFYIVNSTAKSVKTDLALDLLKQRAELDGNVMAYLVESGQDWKVESQAITEQLADLSLTWRRKIRLANEAKGITIIPSSSFVVSLQKFLTYPFIQNFDRSTKYKLLETYWNGVRKAMPEPFEKPEDYTLLKGIGVWAMHEILPAVIEVIRSRGDSLFESYNYARTLEPLFEQLEGENVRAEAVKGHEFWLTAPKGGAAGGFSSSAGKRVLASKMLQALPKPEIE